MPVEEPAAAEIAEQPAAETPSTVADLLTPEEASVFAPEPEIPRPVFRPSNVFVQTEQSTEAPAAPEDEIEAEAAAPREDETEPDSEGLETSTDISDEHGQHRNGDGEDHTS